MTIAFYSNYLNQHQFPILESFNRLENVEYYFIATTKVPEARIRMGYKEYDCKFLIDTTLSKENMKRAMTLAVDADVAIFLTVGVHEYEVRRLKTGKLTFEYGERWLKRGLINLLSPRLIKHQIYYWLYGHKAPLYMLCNSAYAASDYELMGSFKNRCYKWGYFTKVDEDFDVEASADVSTSNITPLMWCSRYLTLKHPELPVLLAKKLKEDGYKFSLDMYGSGEYCERTMELVGKLHLEDVINFYGNCPNEEILKSMRRHRIFLFTSDRHEGWGAVLNECMSNGCVPVTSDAIGATRFLVEDGVNGMVFRSAESRSGFRGTSLSCDAKALESLVEKVEWLLDNPDKTNRMAANAYATMRDVWSPDNAAKNFLRLVDDLSHGRDTSIEEGPCSKAMPI